MAGAVRQQNITWSNIDPDLCRHMVSLGPNELPCIVRSEARRGHEDKVVHEARIAEGTDVSKWPPSASDLTMNGTLCLSLYDMNKLVLDSTQRSRNSQAKFRSGRWRIVHCRKSMHGLVGNVLSNAFVTS